MKPLVPILLGCFRRVFGRAREEELSDELQFHLDGLAEKYVAKGLSQEEARRAALKEFGSLVVVKERCRDERRSSWRDQVIDDLRFGVRQIAKARSFGVVIILTFALGIAAATAIFSVAHGVLLKPLDFPTPDALYVLKETYPPTKAPGGVSWNSFSRWKERSRSFDGFATISRSIGILTRLNAPNRVTTANVSVGYFSVLGIKPFLGRDFREAETADRQSAALIISHAYWRLRCEESASVLAERILFDGKPAQIVGVLPPNVDLDDTAEVFVLARPTAGELSDSTPIGPMTVVARLGAAYSLREAESELGGITESLSVGSGTDERRGVFLVPLRDEILRTSVYMMSDVASVLGLLCVTVALLLGLVCVNIANLLLVHATARRKEIAMRYALGASRGRVVSQLLIENLLLALSGGGLGILSGWGLLRLARPLISNLPRGAHLAMDPPVVVFVCLVIILCGLAFGLVPAWQASQANPNDAIRNVPPPSDGLRLGQARSWVIVVEVALCSLLLFGSGLVVNSFIRMKQVKLGYESTGIFAARLDPPGVGYSTAARQTAFAEGLLDRMARQPQLESAALTTGMPIFGTWGAGFTVPGWFVRPGTPMPSASLASVTPAYFEALGIPLRGGRFFNMRDNASAPRVAIISESIARQYFDGRDPLGQSIILNSGSKEALEVVGVVGDVMQWGPSSANISPNALNHIYRPFLQKPSTANLMFVIKTKGSAKLLPSIGALIQAEAPLLPKIRFWPLEEGLDASVVKYRLCLLTFSVFSGTVLLLATVGIFGVVSYTVEHRRKEFGVRAALGAQGSDLLRLIIMDTGRVVILGLVLGLGVAAGVSRAMSSLIFGIGPRDPATFIAVCVLLSGVALAACLLPMRSVLRADPLASLREE